jgi:two-component system, OmpR family, phosphate regulon sensor histidine kinase PhoR
MPRDWSVGRLLSRAFGALVVLIVCSGLAETSAMLIQHRVVQQLTTHVQPLQLANAHLRAVLADAQRGLRGYLLTGDPRQLDTYLIAHSAYPLAVDDVRALATPGERPAVDAQVAGADTWWSLAERQRWAEPRSDVAARFVAEGKPLFDAFEAANQTFDLGLAARAAGLQRDSARLNVLSVTTVLALTMAAAALAGLTSRRMTRLITRPLSNLVEVLARRRAGDRTVRADPVAGPAEIRAVAAEVNAAAEQSARADAAERDVSRLRSEVRALGYRIRGHLVVEDAVREAVAGLHEILGADHVLIRMAADQTGVPALTSLGDEHDGGPLTALAGCDVTWLNGGDVWATDDPAPAGNVTPPDAERAAWAQVGDGPVLVVAISGGDQRIGALTLIRDTGPAWTPVEVRLAEVVANDLGRGVHLARQYEREHALVVRLQELDTAKTDFMSTVSHELRTPLTSIAGYVELLRDAEAGRLNPGQDRMLEVIGRNTRRLRELIEDMLVLSKIEAGGFRTSKEPVDLAELIDSAVQAITPAAAKASVGLHVEVAGPLPVHADPGQIDRVLGNLLSNAVKFTPADGTVTVTARPGGEEVTIAVADTGMGIPDSEQAALFARFFRASNAIHQAIPGTGLGLAIVKTIVDNHGGRIEVFSTENAGTTFTVRLPA